MKRFLTLLAATLLLTAAMCVTASASDFDAAAEDLSAIGMFRGTANGFELDRAPTRSEAAIMLVRLYGAEEDAKTAYDAGEIKHPFTDVSAFTSPYVAWLYTNGITNGTSSTTFGSGSACSAKMYSAFLLRALGYQDGSDFAYADTLEYAMSRGLLDTSLFTGTFLRDDLAAITYQALACDLKDGSTYLLDSLVKSGAIDAEAAKPMTEKIEAYRGLLAATADTMGTSLDADISADMKMDMSMTGVDDGTPVSEKESMDMTMTGNVQVKLEDGDPQMAFDLTMTTMGETMQTKMWMKDGWMYVRNGEDAYKYEIGDVMGSYQQLLDQSVSQMNVSMLPFIDTITVEKDGGDTVYTLTLNNAMFGMMSSMMDTVIGSTTGVEGLDMTMDVDMKKCTYVYTITRSGQLEDCSAVMDMAMNMDMDAGEAGYMTVAVAMEMDMQMDVNATGDDVKITFPDFSAFEELDMSALESAA